MRLCTLCKRLFSDERPTCPDHARVGSSAQDVSVEPLPAELAARFPQHEAFALGSTGTLYRLGDSSIALKVLHGSLTRDVSERARYRRELRRQQGLIHPQLPRVHDVGESAERVWFTRDFIEGESLAVRLREGPELGLAAAYGVIMQLAAALDALHQLGLVHRDVKPGHVLLRASRSPRESLQLIDATVAGPLTLDDAVRHGTPDYAAKELVEGAPATFRSDLYALGCLSYELFAGAPPFRDATATAAGEALATLSAHRDSEPEELPGNVPEAVRSLITSMLAKDAHRRPFSAQQVRRALEPQIAPANAAARRASLSDTQPRAAALRFSGPAAKPVTPATFPDATVELDVEDLDEAIQVNDEPSAGAAPAPGEAARSQTPADAESSGPTKALNTQNTRAIMSSMLPSASKPGALASDAAKAGPESALRAPTHAPTGTQFGLGPVRAQDIEAATALAAQLKSEPLAAAEQALAADGGGDTSAMPPAVSGAVPAASSSSDAKASAVASTSNAQRPSARRTRYTSAAQPLLEDPRLLLLAAVGLVALIALLRVLLGPSEPSRSAAVVVQVPQGTNEQLDQLDQQVNQQFEELSEAALIGGDIPRPPQPTAEQRRRAARANPSDQMLSGESAQPSAAAADHKAVGAGALFVPAQSIAALAPAPADEPSDDQADARNVQTVNAGSVRGGLARTASNRQAAASGTNISAVNLNNSPDTDYKAKGRALFKAGKYTEAIEAYQRATKRDSTDAAAYAGLGGSLLAKGETRRAISAYQRAVRLQPEVSGFQAALGRAYLQKGDRPRARAAYAKALSLDPNNQAARNGLANTKTR